jgi:hypothetical protein
MFLFLAAALISTLGLVWAGEPICTDAEDYEYSDGSTARENSIRASHSLIASLEIYYPLTAVSFTPQDGGAGGTAWFTVVGEGTHTHHSQYQ